MTGWQRAGLAVALMNLAAMHLELSRGLLLLDALFVFAGAVMIVFGGPSRAE